MIPIKIDISQFINQFQVSKEEAQGLATSILNRLTISLKQGWIDQANSLKSSRNEYQRSIYIKRVDYKTAIVGLTGWLPNAVENGMSPFDEKEGFSHSSKRKISIRTVDGIRQRGWYLTIPFRQATPESIGESEAFTGNMPREIYDIAKNLKQGESISYGMLPEQQRILGIRHKVTSSSGQVYEDYTHKSPLFEGMIKGQKQYHGSYVTFRRVSDKSDNNAFIHTGIESHSLCEKAVANWDVESIVLRERDKFLQSLGF